MPLGIYHDWGTLDIGGQQRMQYKHEIGMGNAVSGPGALRFEDTEFDTALTRTRVTGSCRVHRVATLCVPEPVLQTIICARCSAERVAGSQSCVNSSTWFPHIAVAGHH